MRFDAIVHAPRLRPGARVNIAETDQTEARQRCGLTIGAEVRLRIGVCAPALAFGRVIGCGGRPESVEVPVADLAVVDLVVGEATWRLRRSERDGVAVPGLVSEAWYVVAAIDETASPIDHRPAHSPGDAAAKD